MLLAKIQSSISAYKNWLQSVRQHPNLYKWESLQIFQERWNIEDRDPVTMYDSCFQNSENRNLWQSGNWQPKRMMIEFLRADPMTVRLMFEDLYNESKTAEGRCGRFIFGCDELLRDFKRAHVGTVENNHYHDDFKMIALYLAFRYPENYAPYDFPTFQKTLEILGARDIPQQNDIERFFKVTRTLKTFIDKDPEIEPLLQNKLTPHKHYRGKTLLLVDDFCTFLTAEAQ
ncbi:MAG: hypothetical protein WCR52_10925 [Bacteroidota bacterium]